MSHFFANGLNFLFLAMGISMIVAAFRHNGARQRIDAPATPTLLEDPRVPRLQAEIDELRAQVERLTAAESFYAQLNAGPPRPPGSPTA